MDAPDGVEDAIFDVDVLDLSDRLSVIEVHGQADLHTASDLRGAISGAIDRGAVHLVVDLSEATFIDSSVIHVIVRAAEAVNGSQRAVVLQLGTAAIVERALEIANIEQVLPRAHDRQEAVRIIQQKAETV